MQRFSWRHPFVRASTFVNNLFLNTVIDLDFLHFFDPTMIIVVAIEYIFCGSLTIRKSSCEMPKAALKVANTVGA